MFLGIWRETDQILVKGDIVIVGCARKYRDNDVIPFCTGFAALKINSEGVCPKCGFPLGAKEDPKTKRWMGIVPVT